MSAHRHISNHPAVDSVEAEARVDLGERLLGRHSLPIPKHKPGGPKMDELNQFNPDDSGVPTTNVPATLDPATMKSCLDFLFQAAVDQQLPLVASLIGAASDAMEERLR